MLMLVVVAVVSNVKVAVLAQISQYIAGTPLWSLITEKLSLQETDNKQRLGHLTVDKAIDKVDTATTVSLLYYISAQST